MKYFLWKFIAMTFGCYIGGTIGWMVMDRDLPVILIGSQLVTNYVKPGETFILESEIERKKLCPGKYERMIIDADNVRWILPDIDFSYIGPLGRSKYRQAIQIPAAAAKGEATLLRVMTYHCNIIQEIAPLIYPLPDVKVAIL